MIQVLQFHAMGSEMIAAMDSSQKPVELDQVPVFFEAWEQTFSRFREDSELTLVNRRAGIPTQVSHDFGKVVETSFELEQLSGGIVTPVILDALIMAGYDQSFEFLSGQQFWTSSNPILNLPRLNEIKWNRATRTICFPSDLHLDFSGIVKGWAAFQTVQKLQKICPTLIDAGGDIAVSGPQANGQPWPVGVSNPFQPDQNIELLMISEGGVATSGRDKRRWFQGNHWNHHIIDPRNGLPANTDVLTATVVAPSVIQAEMAAKTCLILGSEKGLEWLDSNSNLAGMIILEDGQYLYSSRFENYRWS